MRVKILGKIWTLVFKRLSKHDGYCEPPTQPNKQIQIDSRLKNEDLLRVTTHEIAHAADWHKSEEWVEEFSTDLARTLWRLGWRKIDQSSDQL